MIEKSIKDINVNSTERKKTPTSYHLVKNENEEVTVNIKEFNTAKKFVSRLEAFLISFGTIIGSGIFKGVQEPYLILKSQDIVFLALFQLVFGILSICRGLCYAELGTRIPETGDEKAYFKKFFNSKISTVFIIFFVFYLRSLVISALVITSATYLLKSAFKDPEEYYLILRSISFAIIIIFFIINLLSKLISTKTGVITTILKTFAAILILGFEIYYFVIANRKIFKKPFEFT